MEISGKKMRSGHLVRPPRLRLRLVSVLTAGLDGTGGEPYPPLPANRWTISSDLLRI
jgi:hypothetical protein